MCRSAFFGIVLACGLSAGGGEKDLTDRIATARKQLEPSLVALKGEYSTDDFLATLAKQTSNVVVDRRQNRSKQSLTLDLEKASFWQALDRFCSLAGCTYTAYGSDGGVALIDGTRRSEHVSYHGITRTAIKRITVTSDLETGAGTCVIYLDVAWEPRFQPFYLGVGPVTAAYVSRGVAKELKVHAPGRGQLPVAGRSASEIEILLPPPPRTSPAIEALEGSFKFVGPSKMLTFRFKDIKADAKLEQEEVSVHLLKVKEGLDRWLIEVQIDNPEGTPGFESYQTWLDNNRISLVSAKYTLSPEPNETVLFETNRKAVVQYAFAAPKKAKLADWALVYRTPGRIVKLTVPYRFKNVPLP